MARSVITQRRTLRRIATQIGRPVLFAMARGNTGHRIDACLPDRSMVSIWPDGTIQTSAYRWSESIEGIPAEVTHPA